MDDPTMPSVDDETPTPLPQEDRPTKGSAAPVAGKCGAKLRLSNPPRYCIKAPIEGRKRCRLHGGESLGGTQAPRFLHGLRSTYLPKGILERYDRARQDPQLLKLREDVALVEAMLAATTARLKDDRPLTARQQQNILALVEQRRRLIDSEARRLKDLHQMISIDRYLTQMAAVGQVILKRVSNKDELAAIHRDLQRMLLAPSTEDD
jgi:hypothetical protein